MYVLDHKLKIRTKYDLKIIKQCGLNILKTFQTITDSFFFFFLSELKVPVLLTGSLEDEYAEYISFEENYKKMLEKLPDGKMYLFKKGGHPAFITVGNEFFQTAKEFFTK